MFEEVDKSLMWTSLLIEHLTSVNEVTDKDYMLLLEEVLDLTNPDYSQENKLKKLVMTIQCPKVKDDKIFFQVPLRQEVVINVAIDAMAYRLLVTSLNIFLKEKENVKSTNIIN